MAGPFITPCLSACDKLASIKKVEVLEYDFNNNAFGYKVITKLKIRTDDLIWDFEDVLPFTTGTDNGNDNVTYMILNANDNTATLVNENVASLNTLNVDIHNGCTFKTPIVINNVIQYVDAVLPIFEFKQVFFQMKNNNVPTKVNASTMILSNEQGSPGNHDAFIRFGTGVSSPVPISESRYTQVNGIQTYAGNGLVQDLNIGSYESKFTGNFTVNLNGSNKESSAMVNSSVGIMPNGLILEIGGGATTLGGATLFSFYVTKGTLHVQVEGNTDILIWRER
jgi:hypothetical protein